MPPVYSDLELNCGSSFPRTCMWHVCVHVVWTLTRSSPHVPKPWACNSMWLESRGVAETLARGIFVWRGGNCCPAGHGRPGPRTSCRRRVESCVWTMPDPVIRDWRRSLWQRRAGTALHRLHEAVWPLCVVCVVEYTWWCDIQELCICVL